MGNHIPEQLALFFRSILLGGGFALVYDLVRPLRLLGGRKWGCLLDSLVSAGAVVSVFFFIMNGDGELRLFILLGAVGGAVLFFSLLSAPLRPIWAFWTEVFLLPVGIVENFLKKLKQICKKLFSFWKTWFTIITKSGQEGDGEVAAQAKTKKKRPSSKLTALILLVLILGIGVQLYNMYGQLQAARAEEGVYATRLEALTAENQRLAQDIANSDDPELIEDIARNDLGMGVSGEKVFRFGS